MIPSQITSTSLLELFLRTQYINNSLRDSDILFNQSTFNSFGMIPSQITSTSLLELFLRTQYINNSLRDSDILFNQSTFNSFGMISFGVIFKNSVCWGSN